MRPGLWAPVGLSHLVPQGCLIVTFFLDTRGLGTLGKHSVRTARSLGWWYIPLKHVKMRFSFFLFWGASEKQSSFSLGHENTHVNISHIWETLRWGLVHYLSIAGKAPAIEGELHDWSYNHALNLISSVLHFSKFLIVLRHGVGIVYRIFTSLFLLFGESAAFHWRNTTAK